MKLNISDKLLISLFMIKSLILDFAVIAFSKNTINLIIFAINLYLILSIILKLFSKEKNDIGNKKDAGNESSDF